MQLGMWTYPWDVQDLTADTVVRELTGRAGLNTICLAASYHAGRFFQPRSPERKVFFPEDGTIYFHPTPRRWAKSAIKPKVADVIVEGRDVLADLMRRRDAGGMNVSCWTVCLHNTRLGMLHPHAVTRNAFGNPNYYNLCPSNADAREYVVTLVEDLTYSYRPDSVELESPTFMGYLHEYHHEKDAVGLTGAEQFLLSVCFCPSCVKRAADAGIEAEKARSAVRGLVAKACEHAVPGDSVPGFPGEGLDAFAPYADLHAYLRWRPEVVTSLVAEIRDRAHPESDIHVIDLADGWREGSDAAALGKVADGIILCAYDLDPAATRALLERGRTAIGPGKYLGAGFRLVFPEISSADALDALVQAAFAGGADGMNFYNYGLIPAARLDWIGAAVRNLPAHRS